MRHPYERLFHYLHIAKTWSCKVGNDGAIRFYSQRLFVAAAEVYNFDGDYAVEGFLRGLCGMNEM